MTIQEIYDKFGIPPNLREHMLTVTAIVQFICQHWTGNKIDQELAKKAALLHDIGNIVKFDFNKHPEFLGSEQARIGYWRQKQKEVIEKYGTDDHLVAGTMLEEISASPILIEIIQSKTLGEAVKVASFDNWESKILLYSDMRVSPIGITSLDDRLANVFTRLEKYRNRPDKEVLISACKSIESQIQGHLDASLATITSTLPLPDPAILQSTL